MSAEDTHETKANDASVNQPSTQEDTPKPEAFTSKASDKASPSLASEGRAESEEISNKALENQDDTISYQTPTEEDGDDVVSYQTPTEEDGDNENEEESQTSNSDQGSSLGTTETGSNQAMESKY
jgi:hypothetical protein